MNRRSMLRVSLALFTVPPLVLNSQSAEAIPPGVGESEPVQFLPNQRVPTVEDFLNDASGLTGDKPAYEEEVTKGLEILERSPKATVPSDVAAFFARLQQGDFGASESAYAREWPIRANPVIVSFFDATTLRTPQGDVTPWCAAFVNWCIWRSRLDRPAADQMLEHTKSAAAASFRSWGTATTTPRFGDIVAFVNKADVNRGHVGFFVSETPDSVFVLGGNQRPSARPGEQVTNPNNGEVNVSVFKKDGRSLKLHSYRTDSSLHG